MKIEPITARTNPLLVLARRLAAGGHSANTLDAAGLGGAGQAQALWLEGDHLCRAWLQRGCGPVQAVLVTQAAWDQTAVQAWVRAARPQRVAVLPEAVFRSVSGLGSPAQLGCVCLRPAAPALLPQAPTVVLDRVQDAGNVGSILRSAAALGLTQVLALQGTAGLWTPKVVRAGMGAHFGLRLLEGLALADLMDLQLPLVATSSHAATALGDVALPAPCAWVLGHEGQGVRAELLECCTLQVRIPQPGGEESLNVAAAAAICLYESWRQRAQGGTSGAQAVAQ